ncbi:MAG: hypothetical protein IT159_00645 [Bryobacterales bacterium]|nr:hypothetical protein [Bryobacterales bacterium]
MIGASRWPALALGCIALSAAFGAPAGGPESWVPIRWQGGPLEVARRTLDGTLPQDSAVREALARWYEPETLDLLAGSPVNCLLVTWSSGGEPSVEEKQHALVGAYARRAREKGIAVLGLVYAGASPARFVPPAIEAGLDGLMVDGGPEGGAALTAQVANALRSAGSAALVLTVAGTPAEAFASSSAVAIVQGVWPGARNLADMGIRSGPSADSWIDSNIWLVRYLRAAAPGRPVWISSEPRDGAATGFLRCAAEAAVAGGRWIIAPDDQWRAAWLRKAPEALAKWERLAACLKFAAEHAEWRSFTPYGKLGIVVDPAGPSPDASNEYLNLAARRQIPYRVILRPRLDREALAGLQALLAADLSAPTSEERALLGNFAGQGGLVVAGPSWGVASKDQPYVELPLAKGRVVVYRDDPPDPEEVARDLLDLLSTEQMGVSAFNVPSVLVYAGTGGPSGPVLIQLLNYSGFPAEAITLRVNGSFKRAWLHQPGAAAVELTLNRTGQWTELAVRELAVWGGVLLEQ